MNRRRLYLNGYKYPHSIEVLTENGEKYVNVHDIEQIIFDTRFFVHNEEDKEKALDKLYGKIDKLFRIIKD